MHECMNVNSDTILYVVEVQLNQKGFVSLLVSMDSPGAVGVHLLLFQGD